MLQKKKEKKSLAAILKKKLHPNTAFLPHCCLHQDIYRLLNIHLIVFIVQRLIRSKPLPFSNCTANDCSASQVFLCLRVCERVDNMRREAWLDRSVLSSMCSMTCDTSQQTTQTDQLNNVAHFSCQQLLFLILTEEYLVDLKCFI